MENMLFEVCCASADDALQAQKGGAHRIELNSSLFLGGLTPSIGTFIETKKRVDIPIMVMIRPRSGGFCYTGGEFASMVHDAKIMIERGADGIVFGILHENGNIDMKRCKGIIELAGEREVVFHRAFDVVPDPFEALDQLVDLGVKRVMTSGQERSVHEGMALIGELIGYAEKRIEILPAGGIRLYNVEEIIQRTGCDQLHFSGFGKQYDGSTAHRPQVSFGGALYPPEDSYDMINPDIIKAIRDKVGNSNY